MSPDLLTRDFPKRANLARADSTTEGARFQAGLDNGGNGLAQPVPEERARSSLPMDHLLADQFFEAERLANCDIVVMNSRL